MIRLFEGGNVFKDEQGIPVTRRINRNEIMPTIKWLEKLTGIDLTQEKAPDGLPIKWLGSTGRKESSGDLDLAVNSQEISKSELESQLKNWAVKNGLNPKEWIAKSGISVHFKTPILGDIKNGFAQTDFMFIDNPEWGTFLLSQGPSEYKGVFREVLLNNVAKGTVTSEHPQGLRLSMKGLVDRATGEFITFDVDTIAKTLFGKDGSKQHMMSVEDIYAKLANDPNKERKTSEFEAYARSKGVEPPGSAVQESVSDQMAKLRNLVVENSAQLDEAAASPRIPHPEDAIFDGSAEAKKYLDALKQAIANPGTGSIKWDGGIALYFGRLDNGTFVVTDKYMPNKGVYPASPTEWVEYDRARGANRADLYSKIELIWPGLEQAVGNTKGLFKGDLMAAGKLTPTNGYYVFKPTTVEYRVPVNSELGKLIKGKVGIVVAHQFNGAPWHGDPAVNNSTVAIITPKAGINFSIKEPKALVSAADSAISRLGAQADDFLSGLSNVAREAIKKYFNHKITKQTNDTLLAWLETNVSGKQYQFLVGDNDGYLVQNKQGLDAVIKIWNAVYQLKENLAQQLETQVTGFEQWTGGTQEGEGFVFPTTAGLVKIVNRAGFGATHFNK
jgi:hypothetical protein